MPADALAPKVARAPAGMVLGQNNRKKRFKLCIDLSLSQNQFSILRVNIEASFIILSYPESIIDAIVTTEFGPQHNELVTDRGNRRGCPGGRHRVWNQETGKSEHYRIILQCHAFMGLFVLLKYIK